MSSEKQNSGWKETLLAWEKAGGNTEQQKDLLWGKLQVRLQPRSGKRSVYFFRAAAVLLFAMGCLLFLVKQRSFSGKSIGLATAGKTIIPGPPKQRDAIAATKNLPGTPQINSFPKITPPLTGEHEIPAPKENTVPPDTAVMVIITPREEYTPQPVTMVVPQKKKLKVVHMNEWNIPPPPTYATLKESWDKNQLSPDPDHLPLPERSIWPGKNRSRQPASSDN